MSILTIKKLRDQKPLFFFHLREMNEIRYVRNIRDPAQPIIETTCKKD